MDARRLQLSLAAAQLVAVATLLRSVAYDRWITVVASLLLLGGATAARGGRAWGVALAFASAVAFPVAWAIGIAPAWFCGVGVVGALPFVLTSRAFARFDRGATALLAGIAVALGAAGALAWKHVAWSVFSTFPSLMPSVDAQHGLALAGVLGAVLVTMGLARAANRERRVRVEGRVRVAASLDARSDARAELAEELDDPVEDERAWRSLER